MLMLVVRLVMWSSLVVIFLFYPLAAWLVLRPGLRQKTWLFALVNVLGAYAACTATLATTQYSPGAILVLMKVVAPGFMAYLLLLMVHFVLLDRSRRSERWGQAALFFPVLILVLMKYITPFQHAFSTVLQSVGIPHLSALFLGLSYMTFRLCHLVQEVRNEVVTPPTLAEYLSFAFFVPTLSLGPINPYSRFIQSYRHPDRSKTPLERSLLRLLVGLTKFFFLSTLLNQYTYTGLLLDGHPHHWIDLPIAVFAYTLYLYCNFSGFCDMVIGVSGLLGIEVMENFNRPFAARNFQEFWARWHISLSTWLRDMMFTPLVKALTRKTGPKHIHHVIAFSICAVFVVIGVWHGVGINFALFGLAQGLGVATVHYYTHYLRAYLGKQRYAAYRENRWIHAAAVVTTFVYFSASLFLLANNWTDVRSIFHALV